MSEEIEPQAVATEEATATEDSGYGDILAPKGTDGESSVPAEKPLEKTEAPSEQPVEDPEVIVEIKGKSYTMKESEALQLFENASKMTEREKAIADKEKSLNKDYTQKTQALAGIRKSFEDNFGRLPEANELKALGKVWKAYFENPQVAGLLNQIIAGTYRGGNAPESNGKAPDAYTQQLEQKIAQLEGKLDQFSSSLEEREASKSQADAQGQWNSWVAKKAEASVQITEEIDAAMSPFVQAIRHAHPDWEAHKVLDEAYRHATIDTIQGDTAKKVLTSVDKAKKAGAIRITPKTPQKSEKEMGYKDIIQESMSS